MASGECIVNGNPIPCEQLISNIKDGMGTVVSNAKCYKEDVEVDCAQLGSELKQGVKNVGYAILLGFIYSFIITVIMSVFIIISALGAGKLAYQRSGTMLFAIPAFIFSPLYYMYYAFTQPTV